jgi:hypothetical protein
VARKNVADAAKAKAEKQKKIAIGLILLGVTQRATRSVGVPRTFQTSQSGDARYAVTASMPVASARGWPARHCMMLLSPLA